MGDISRRILYKRDLGGAETTGEGTIEHVMVRSHDESKLRKKLNIRDLDVVRVDGGLTSTLVSTVNWPLSNVEPTGLVRG